MWNGIGQLYILNYRFGSGIPSSSGSGIPSSSGTQGKQPVTPNVEDSSRKRKLSPSSSPEETPQPAAPVSHTRIESFELLSEDEKSFYKLDSSMHHYMIRYTGMARSNSVLELTIPCVNGRFQFHSMRSEFHNPFLYGFINFLEVNGFNPQSIKFKYVFEDNVIIISLQQKIGVQFLQNVLLHDIKLIDTLSPNASTLAQNIKTRRFRPMENESGIEKEDYYVIEKYYDGLTFLGIKWLDITLHAGDRMSIFLKVLDSDIPDHENWMDNKQEEMLSEFNDISTTFDFCVTISKVSPTNFKCVGTAYKT